MKKFIIKFFLALSLFISFGSTSFAEYLIVKKTKTLNVSSDEEMIIPTAQDYNRAIDIVMQWKFPLYLRDIERVRSLEEQDLQLLCKNEQQFIEKKLKEAGLDLELIFIPTVFYEFFILTDFSLCGELINKEFIRYEYMNNSSNLPQDNLNIPENSFLEEFYDEYQRCNYNNDFYVSKDFYYKVNNNIFIYLKKKHFSLYGLFFSIITRAFREYSDLDIEQKKVTKYILKYLNNKIKFLEEVFDYEILAHEYGCFSLYRGTYGYGDDLDTLKSERELMGLNLSDYGLSYGSSIFAGILNDHGATAFTYIFDNDFIKKERGEDLEAIGYFLFIPKFGYLENFVKRGILSNLFVAPVNTINGLISKGELFHSRFLAVCSEDDSFIIKARKFFQNYLKKFAYIFKNRIRLEKFELFGEDENPYGLNLPYTLALRKRKQSMGRRAPSIKKRHMSSN